MSTVLAIDDTADNLLVVTAVLKNVLPDVRVLTAQSGPEGLEMAESEQPDVILLDIIMPDMDGYAVCRAIKAGDRTRAIPVIMLTAVNAAPHDRIRALELGADAFLTKPIDGTELAAQIQVMLRMKAAEDALRRDNERLERLVRERTDLLRANEHRLHVALQATNLGLWDWNIRTGDFFGDGRWAEIQGESLHTIPQSPDAWQKRVHPDDVAEGMTVWNAYLQGRAPLYCHEYRIRHVSGQWRWVASYGKIVEWDCAENPVRIIGTVQDITARKQVEERLTTSLREKDTLLQEVYHRTKNNMAVICAMLALQTDHLRDDATITVLTTMSNRIRSMALVHEQLYQSQNLSRINLRTYTEELAHSLLVNDLRYEDQISLALDLDTLDVSIETAMPYGQIVNELLMNSLQHAFPGNRRGEVRIGLHRDVERDDIVLDYADDGVGLPPGYDVRQAESFGFELLLLLTETQLNGTVSVNSDSGTHVGIRFRELCYAPCA